jgi:hypothetical protein
VCPYFLIAPWRRVRVFGALASIAYMAGIILSGNYATINYITIVPIIASLDDQFLQRVVPRSWQQRAAQAQHESVQANATSSALHRVKTLLLVCFAVCVGYKSIEPIKESLSPSPWLAYYDDYFLVNSYGVFGFVNSVRFNPVLHYIPHSTSDADYALAMRQEAATSEIWRDLNFPCLPGTTTRTPCISAPYHYRFDWEVWIYSTASLEHSRDFSRFVPMPLYRAATSLLAGDTRAALLFAKGRDFVHDGFPRAIRISLWKYELAPPSQLLANGTWWRRQRVRQAQPVTLEAKSRSNVAPLDYTRDWLLCAWTFCAALIVKARSSKSASNAAFSFSFFTCIAAFSWTLASPHNPNLESVSWAIATLLSGIAFAFRGAARFYCFALAQFALVKVELL